ncbi:hypothetical protein DFH11DRAFT_1048648 [Phellopilus nigrolimitatus]|nr:hypothetical protein DFH11DRAFT_1048648 [Phellopilus nigrolimitatus]
MPSLAVVQHPNETSNEVRTVARYTLSRFRKMPSFGLRPNGYDLPLHFITICYMYVLPLEASNSLAQMRQEAHRRIRACPSSCGYLYPPTGDGGHRGRFTNTHDNLTLGLRTAVHSSVRLARELRKTRPSRTAMIACVRIDLLFSLRPNDFSPFAEV